MTEEQLQIAIWHWRKHKLIVPNSQLFIGESDVLSITAVGYSYTHEIKTTHSDFLNEFRSDWKKKWHGDLHDMYRGENQKDAAATKYFQHRLPNYYLYVCPEGLIAENEIQDYAGLVYFRQYKDSHPWSGCFREIKRPRRIHKKKIETDQILKLGRSLMWRYWGLKESRCEND